ADLCKRMAISFGPTNSEMMREVADLWQRLPADAGARAATPLRPLGVSLNGRPLECRRHAGTQGRMNAVLQIRSAPATSRRHSEQKDCYWFAPNRSGDLHTAD